MIKFILFIIIVSIIIYIFKDHYPKIVFYLKRSLKNPIVRSLALRSIIRVLRLFIFRR